MLSSIASRPRGGDDERMWRSSVGFVVIAVAMWIFVVGLRAAQVAEVLVTLGERAHIIAEAARRTGMKKTSVIEFDELEPLMEWLRTNLNKNDVVLIKGSRGLRMDRITTLLEVRS